MKAKTMVVLCIYLLAGTIFAGGEAIPDGHIEMLHLWPGQNAPPQATV